ncbi:hypothetical protein Tco_0015340 [Tanacetum coccineum]
MCRQSLPPPLSLPSAKLMIMALEEYGHQSRRGIRVPKKWRSSYSADVICFKKVMKVLEMNEDGLRCTTCQWHYDTTTYTLLAQFPLPPWLHHSRCLFFGSGFVGLESVSIRRIQGVGYSILEFLGVRSTFDIFQNILFPYRLNTAYCLSWIRRIGFVSFVVFGERMHRYVVSSLMDTAYWLSEQ